VRVRAIRYTFPANVKTDASIWGLTEHSQEDCEEEQQDEVYDTKEIEDVNKYIVKILEKISTETRRKIRRHRHMRHFFRRSTEVREQTHCC
jgi:hypothetical protein